MANEAISDKDLADNKRPASRRASESGDPTVHILLGQRVIHEQNLEALAPPDNDEALKFHKDAIRAIDEQLEDLGYEV